MEERLSILSIIVEDRTKASTINDLLGEFGEFIIGRMGLPKTPKDVSVIVVVINAPMESINKLTGKIGQIEGVSAKTLTTKY